MRRGGEDCGSLWMQNGGAKLRRIEDDVRRGVKMGDERSGTMPKKRRWWGGDMRRGESKMRRR